MLFLGGQRSWESSLSGRSQLKNKPLFSNTWHVGAGISQYSLYGLFSWTLINCQWEDLIFVKSNLRCSRYHVPVMVHSRGKKFYLTACAETQGACGGAGGRPPLQALHVTEEATGTYDSGHWSNEHGLYLENSTSCWEHGVFFLLEKDTRPSLLPKSQILSTSLQLILWNLMNHFFSQNRALIF